MGNDNNGSEDEQQSRDRTDNNDDGIESSDKHSQQMHCVQSK